MLGCFMKHRYSFCGVPCPCTVMTRRSSRLVVASYLPFLSVHWPSLLMVLMPSFLVVASKLPAAFSLSCSRRLHGHGTSGIRCGSCVKPCQTSLLVLFCAIHRHSHNNTNNMMLVVLKLFAPVLYSQPFQSHDTNGPCWSLRSLCSDHYPTRIIMTSGCIATFPPYVVFNTFARS